MGSKGGPELVPRAQPGRCRGGMDGAPRPPALPDSDPDPVHPSDPDRDPDRDPARTSAAALLTPELHEKTRAVFHRLKDVPVGRGLMLDGHVAIVHPDGTLDLNFPDAALRHLRAARKEVETACAAVGGVRGRLMLRAAKNVPVRDILDKNLVFRHDAANSDIPKRVRKHYGAILKGLTPLELVAVRRALEVNGDAVCVPLAIIKHRLSGGLLRCVVGSLGIRESRGGDVYDWEYGGEGGTAWR